MSKTLQQIFALNPTTVINDTDLFYLVQSPYTPGSDAGISGLSLKSIFVLSTAVIDPTHGGTGISSYILGDTIYASGVNTLAKLAGNITTTKQFLSQTGTGVISAAPSWSIVSGSDIAGAALSAANDTNVTLTLGGTPLTALLRAASITAGWTGQLSVARGGTGLASVTAHNLLVGNGTTALTLLAPSVTTGVPLISQGASADPIYGTALVAGGGTGLTTLTAFNLLVGNGTGNVALVAPSATTGVPLISQGAASNPVYGTAVVAGGGTGNTTFTAFAVICAGTTATGAFQNVSGVGSTGNVLTSNGPGALPTWQAVTVAGQALTRTNDTNVTVTLGGAPATALVNAASLTMGWTGQLSVARGGTGVAAAKFIIQQVSTETGTVATGTTLIPTDNTIPQITEGDEYMTLAITPTSATNILVIEAQGYFASSNATNKNIGMALFQDATANALAASICPTINAAANFTSGMIAIKHRMVAGTTSATTFRIRAGADIAGTTTFNGAAATQRYGGVLNSYIMITEITP